MCKRIGIGLVRLGLMAAFVTMVGSEASAAICTSTKTRTDQKCVSWKTLSSGGPQFCTQWCTGSAVVDILVKAVDGRDINACTASQNQADPTCPELSATVYGMEGLDAGNNSCENPPDFNLDLSCDISGFGFCLPPGCDPGHRNDPQCRNFFSNGQPMDLQDGLTESGFFAQGDCTRNGTCALSLELEAQPTNTVCPNDNWVFRFIPERFFAETEFCPGGSANNLCCASTARRNSGSECATVFTNSEGILGQPSRNLLRCELIQSPPTLGVNQGYNCNEVNLQP